MRKCLSTLSLQIHHDLRRYAAEKVDMYLCALIEPSQTGNAVQEKAGMSRTVVNGIANRKWAHRRGPRSGRGGGALGPTAALTRKRQPSPKRGAHPRPP